MDHYIHKREMDMREDEMITDPREGSIDYYRGIGDALDYAIELIEACCGKDVPEPVQWALGGLNEVSESAQQHRAAWFRAHVGAYNIESLARECVPAPDR